MKKCIKCIIFLIIFCILWKCVFLVLWCNTTNVSYFYDEPKNSLDIVYIGSSNVHAHYNAPLAYELYGFTTGLLTTNSQPFSSIKYLLEEARKYQSPKLYIIDISKVGDALGNTENQQERLVIDSLKNSKNRMEAIKGILKYTNVKKEDYIKYYFSFLLYHNKWKNIDKRNIIGNKELYKGYYFGKVTYQIEEQEDYYWNNDEKLELKQENKEVFEDLIDYIKANKLNVLFVISKRAYINNGNEYINWATSVIQENGLEVINFNTLKDFNVDFNKDFYNFAHLNVWGATKYTIYFSKYLKEHYDLPNHKDDEKYNSWKSEYERFKVDYKKAIGDDFENLLK